MENLIFTIDVGTRKMAAIVAKKDEKLVVIGSSYRVHHDRALIDGQVEDIEETAKHIKLIKEKLQQRLGITLTKVNLAVAGRGLRSIKTRDGIDITGDEVSEEEMKQAVLQALLKAQREFPSAGLVGYNINAYFIDGYMTQNPKYRRGRKLEAEVIATFLPEQPVFALMKAAELAGLEVTFITLEPIAAITATIPPEIRYFHIALVDIGGGTSDISISKDGRIIGYDVIPIAGDEITEALSNKYLLPFTAAERIKIKLTTEEYVQTRDILGNKVTISQEEYMKTIYPIVDELTSKIAEKIINLGGTPPRAVILVGGGSRTPLIRTLLSQKLNLPQERVGIRFPLGRGFKILPRRLADPAWAVAVGTTLLASEQQGVPLIKVNVNGIPITLFSLTSPTVKEALARLGLSIKNFYGKPSPGIVITVDNKLVSFSGDLGKPPRILVNGSEASLDTPLSDNDQIIIQKGKDGHPINPSVNEVINKVAPSIYVNNKKIHIDFKLLDENKNIADKIVDGKVYSLYPSTIKDLIAELKSNFPEIHPLENIPLETPLSHQENILLVTRKETDVSLITPEKSADINKKKITIMSPLGTKEIEYLEEDIIASVLSRIPQILSKLMEHGNKISIYLNGRKVAYSTPLSPGDTIELKVED